jgi:hypothetical protein
MSTIEPGTTRTTRTETGRTEGDIRGRSTDTFRRPSFRETKPSFMTTEFWAMLIGVAALIVVYNASDEPSLNLWRTCVLATVLAVGYFVSRGLAKAGSRDYRGDDDDGRY